MTAAVPAAVLAGAGPGAYRTFWTLFGTSNQRLAALTLLAITVWLRQTGRPCWFTAAPYRAPAHRPSMSDRFWTAAPDAPLPRLSSRATSSS